MRPHAGEHAPYADLKRTLATRYRDDRAAYTDAKSDYLWTIVRRADRWAAQTGWQPGPSDA
ncbi:GrpB family protein [Ensifer sp. MJa1]|uniref:GrpB family protein n=1 Tax=Ensifer sp. MJa1 TaxID=2919888 RepID=UPI003FA5B59B